MKGKERSEIRGRSMAEPPTSSLTVVKLKALCTLNDLPTSGKKADLVKRLLDAGVPGHQIGVKEKQSVPEPEEEIILSLEDEDTLTPSESPASFVPESVSEQSDDVEEIDIDEDILDAEVFDAELVEIEDEPEPFTPQQEKQPQELSTLIDVVKQPKVAATILALLIVSAAGWYYFESQLEAFTPDQLRYGDRMTYTISDGSIIATEEYVELVLSAIESDEDICKISVDFNGLGDISITNGDGSQLVTQSSLDRLGAVRMKGGHGGDWLTVESTNSYDLKDFDAKRYYPSALGSGACSSDGEGREGSANIDITTWTELRERETLATQVDFEISLGDEFKGSARTYGVGGILGELASFSPSLMQITQPVELSDFFGSSLITDGATGKSEDWNWRVLGIDTIGSTKMWKIIATHERVQSFCLGTATITMWLDGVTPWATHQQVDIVIDSDADTSASCSPEGDFVGDTILPEGTLEIHHKFERTFVERGSKTLELGLRYDLRPEANQFKPDEADLNNWGPEGETSMPDNSTMRDHSLEDAIDCLPQLENVQGMESALQEGGYFWRALDQRYESGETHWNVSWVSPEGSSGWTKFKMENQGNSTVCTTQEKGVYDDTTAHDRQGIPATYALDYLETEYSTSGRISSEAFDMLYESNGELLGDVQVGYLVLLPGEVGGFDLSALSDELKGVVTVDFSKTWEEGNWDHSFNLVGDAADGRVLGYTHLQVFES